jgi:hypothetical protein
MTSHYHIKNHIRFSALTLISTWDCNILCLNESFRLIDEGGDWDRRNRLKVYRGTYCMSIRDFKKASGLFLDTVATFTSYELMDYPQFVTYTVYCSMIALERTQLRTKVHGHIANTAIRAIKVHCHITNTATCYGTQSHRRQLGGSSLSCTGSTHVKIAV